jgi:hypothetical protein
MQLVAYGAQDVYLTGTPQITFFKLMYRRHTNFSIEAIEQTFSGTTALGQRCQAIISRNGDLLHRMYLQVDLPELDGDKTDASAKVHAYVNKLGHALIKKAEVEIGGQVIDRTYARWMDLWHSLTAKSEKTEGYADMTGVLPDAASDIVFRPKATTIYVPINFWFSKGSAGAALPLIALQYHEVKITLELAPLSEIIVKENAAATAFSAYGHVKATSLAAADLTDVALNFKLFADFIYLDTEERRRFAQTSHEYLIEQTQFTGEESVSSTSNYSYRLNMNHPCKAFYWQFVPAIDNVIADPFYALTAETATPSTVGERLHAAELGAIKSVKLQLNGHERFTERPGSYFERVQPYQHHTRMPKLPGIGVYSFCISPEEHQPSGALNMSRVDTANLNLTFKEAKAGTLYVYAVNYNVLRILSGMGGLAFSN